MIRSLVFSVSAICSLSFANVGMPIRIVRTEICQLRFELIQLFVDRRQPDIRRPAASTLWRAL